MNIARVRFLVQLFKQDSGEDLIEYVLLAMMVALGAVAVTRGLAGDVGTTYSQIGSKLGGAVGSADSGGNQGGGGNNGGNGNHGNGNNGNGNGNNGGNNGNHNGQNNGRGPNG
jgi:Flp pilus assembly pilin Flp